MTNVVFFSLLILCSLNVKAISDTTGSRTPDAIFLESFSSIDSIAAAVSGTTCKSNNFQRRVDSIVENVLDKNQLIQGVSMLDNSGAVIKDYNRAKKTIAAQNVASRDWFTIPRTGQIPFFGGIVRANSKNCLLKSYPLALDKNISKGVLVVLVDAAQFLKQIEFQFKNPFTVTYKSVQLYSSSPENTALPFHTTIAGYDNLAISYGAENISASFVAAPTNQKSPAKTLFSLPLPLMYVIITLVLALISFMWGRSYLKKFKDRRILELEYEKISKEQQKQIHDRALSQVYCEVKRQIETHEMGKIEDEIRHKIEHDVQEKVLAGCH